MSGIGEGFQCVLILMDLEDFNNNTPKEKKKPKLDSLLRLLRSDEPISRDIRNLLADLFDPKKPIEVFAKIEFSKRGRRSKGLRDYELYKRCEALKSDNGWKKISEIEWKKISDGFHKEDPPYHATKKAYARGRRIDDQLISIRREQEKEEEEEERSRIRAEQE